MPSSLQPNDDRRPICSHQQLIHHALRPPILQLDLKQNRSVDCAVWACEIDPDLCCTHYHHTPTPHPPEARDAAILFRVCRYFRYGCLQRLHRHLEHTLFRVRCSSRGIRSDRYWVGSIRCILHTLGRYFDIAIKLTCGNVLQSAVECFLTRVFPREQNDCVMNISAIRALNNMLLSP